MESPDNTVVTVVKDGQGNVRPRRSTRVVIRLAVRIAHVNATGSVDAILGWSVVVNQYGCKLESKRPMALRQVVEITVIATGRSGRGKIVWASTAANREGNYECAVQFEKATNLWGVDFPPEDWPEDEGSRELMPPDTPSESIPVAEKPAAEEEALLEIPLEVIAPAPQVDNTRPPSPQIVIPPAEPVPAAPSIVIPPPPAPLVTEPAQPRESVSSSPAPVPLSPSEGPTIAPRPVDRFTDAVRDLIQATIAAGESIAAERLAKSLEERIARMQQDVLDRLSTQVQSLAAMQTTAFSESAAAITTASQNAFSASVKEITATAGEELKALQSEAVSAAEVAFENLRSDAAQHLSQAEQEFVTRCRSAVEQSLSGLVDNSLRTISQRIVEADQELDTLADRARTVLQDCTAQLDQQAASRVEQTTRHLDAQLKTIAQGISSEFQQSNAEAMSTRQQAFETAFQQNLAAVSESSLREVQGGLARILQGLADRLKPVVGEAPTESGPPPATAA